MALLIDTRTAPPGGWRYVQRETGCRILAGSLGGVAEQLVAHRRYKKLPGADMATAIADIQRQLCQILEPRFCRAEPGEEYRPVEDRTLNITEDQAIAFSKTAVEFLKTGAAFVSKDESKARADTCRGCPFNRAPAGCACSAFHRLINLFVPTDRLEKGVNSCAVCGCSLRAKILMPQSAIEAGNAGQDLPFPEYCWQRKKATP